MCKEIGLDKIEIVVMRQTQARRLMRSIETEKIHVHEKKLKEKL